MMILIASITAAAIAAFWVIHLVRRGVLDGRAAENGVATVYIRHFWLFGATAGAIAAIATVAAFVVAEKPTWQAIPAAVLAIVALAFGERRWSRPSGQVRTVPLVVRRLRDHVPIAGVVVAAVALLAAVVVVSLCWMIGNTDGTSISRNVPINAEGLNTVASVEGFPGWPQGALAFACGAALLIGVVYTVRSAVVRPALPGVTPSDDLTLRRAAIDRLLRIVAVCGWVTTLLFLESARAVVISDEWPVVVRSDWKFGWLSPLCIVAAALSLVLFRTLTPRATSKELAPAGSGARE